MISLYTVVMIICQTLRLSLFELQNDSWRIIMCISEEKAAIWLVYSAILLFLYLNYFRLKVGTTYTSQLQVACIRTKLAVYNHCTGIVTGMEWWINFDSYIGF